jgi:hypothetical protein
MVDLTIRWIEQEIDRLLSWKDRFGKWVNDWHSYLSRRIDSLGDDMDDMAADVILIPSTVRKAVDDAKGAILSAVNDTYIIPLSHYVDALQMDVRDWIGDIRSDISEMDNSIITVFDFINHIDEIIDARIDAFKDKIIGWIEDKFISIVEHVLEQEVK